MQIVQKNRGEGGRDERLTGRMQRKFFVEVFQIKFGLPISVRQFLLKKKKKKIQLNEEELDIQD